MNGIFHFISFKTHLIYNANVDDADDDLFQFDFNV